MPYAWIVVADASLARFFSSSAPKGELNLEKKMSCNKARAANRDLVTDAPGRTFDSHGVGRHANDGDNSPKEHIACQFAKDVSRELTKARQKGAFDRLYIIADPRFLGLLNKSFDRPLQKVIVGEINKNMARHSVEEIRNVLPVYL